MSEIRLTGGRPALLPFTQEKERWDAAGFHAGFMPAGATPAGVRRNSDQSRAER